MRERFIDFIKAELIPETGLIACGLPASYKTETTEVIAKVKEYRILRTDMIRLEVLKNEDIFDEKVASNMEKRKLVIHIYPQLILLWFSPKSSLRRQSGMSFFRQPAAFTLRASWAHDKYRV